MRHTLNEQEVDDDPLNATVICNTEDDTMMDVENTDPNRSNTSSSSLGFTIANGCDKSPQLHRISSRFNTSFNLGSATSSTNELSFSLEPPPTPTYDNRNYISQLRFTPPSPSSLPLKDITNQQPLDSIPSKLRKNLINTRSNSHPQLPARRLYYDDDAVPGPDSAPSSPLKKRAITQSTSSLPAFHCSSSSSSSSSGMEDFATIKSMSFEHFPVQAAITEQTEEEMPLILPTISDSDFLRINGETVERLLSGEFDHLIEKYMIMDCRYDYEYEGGHIRGATRMCPELIFDFEMPEPIRKGENRKPIIIIMHCEFSSVRAPTCIRRLKQKDRHTNHMRGYAWPLCSYPNVYLLDGGYKRFFETKQHLCEPQAYVPETHKQHTVQRARSRSERKSQLLLQKSNSFKF